MNRSFSVAFAVLLLAGVCVGQSLGSVEVFGGFSYVDQDFSLTVPNGVTGWNASATFKLVRHMGFVADFGGYYPGVHGAGCGTCGETGKIHTFLFGPQVSMAVGGVTPFARFLVGDSHVTTTAGQFANSTFTSTNSLTVGAGGGVEFRLTRIFGVRGQVDWLHTRFQTQDEQRRNDVIPNVARVSAGVVLRF